MMSKNVEHSAIVVDVKAFFDLLLLPLLPHSVLSNRGCVSGTHNCK